MPGKTLGLDINEDSVTAVQVMSGLKGYQITACGSTLIQDEGLQGALKGLSQQMDLKSDTYIASVSGERVSFRNLQMPFKEKKKIRQTLPFEIETLLPFPVDDLIVDFSMITREERSEILAASVKKTTISDCLSQLEEHGIDPLFLDIRCVPTVSRLLKREETPENGLFLEIGLKRSTMILFLNRRIVLIRPLGFDGSGLDGVLSNDGNEDSTTPIAERIESQLETLCTRVQNTVHAFRWQNHQTIVPAKLFFTGWGALYSETGNLLNRFLKMPTEQTDMRGESRILMDKNIAHAWNSALMDNALALALRDDKKTEGFNFRKDEFEVKKHYAGLKKEIRKVAVFLTIIFAFLAADLGVDYYLVKKRYTQLEQSIRDIYKKTFPEVTRIIDPVQEMRVKLNELKKASIASPGNGTDQRVLDLMKDISERVPKTADVLVTSMVVDPETVRLSGETDTFNTVDSLKSGLEPSAYFSAVTIAAANLDRSGKRVQFELKLQRKNQ